MLEQGMVRAEQDSLALSLGKAAAQNAVAGLLIHGDASFSGLGIVAECLQLSNVPGRDLCPFDLQRVR